MKKVSAWLSAFRLRTLPLSLSGIIVGTCMAEYNGLYNHRIFILAVLTTVSYQILSNLANDYGDGVKGTDNDDRLGPKRAIQSGSISKKDMQKALGFNTLVCIVLTVMLIFTAFKYENGMLTLVFLVLGIASIIAGFKYTMGSNPYGYSGKGDIFVFLFFGLISVMGSYVLYAKRIDHVTFLPALSIGLLSVAVLNLNNMRDITSDKAANKITLVVKMGLDKAKKYHVFLIISAIALSFLFGLLYYTSPYNLIYFVVYIPLLIHLKKVLQTTTSKAFDPELKKVALSTFFLALLLGIGHLL